MISQARLKRKTHTMRIIVKTMMIMLITIIIIMIVIMLMITDQVELLISQARLKRKTHASPNGIASGLKRKREEDDDNARVVKRQYEYIQVLIQNKFETESKIFLICHTFDSGGGRRGHGCGQY